MDELEGYKVLSGADPAEDYIGPFYFKETESGYDFDVGIVDTGNDFTHTFSFSDLKLESSAYQMNVNDQMTYSLSFSHEITN